MKNIEIEIKIKLNDPKKLVKWLRTNAKKIGESNQEDHYFEHELKSFRYKDEDDYTDADEWLRVRIADNKHEICYKKWYRDGKKSTYCDEIETTVGDPYQVLEIFKRLGFKETSVIKKHRASWKYQDFRFDCDEVNEIGFFIEIEFTGEADTPMQGKQKIYDLLKEIGLTEWKKTRRGYSWIQWNPGREHFDE